MKLSVEEKEKLECIYNTFLHNEKILQMKEVSMHRGSNTYLHSFRVAKLAIKRALRRKRRLDLESILIGAILHDYYLYDWRNDKSKKKHHARNHPFIASDNAKRDFDISEAVSDIIKEHMWPFNIKYFPKTTEARIVNNADNTVAFKEAMCSIKYKKKRMDNYYKKIESLF